MFLTGPTNDLALTSIVFEAIAARAHPAGDPCRVTHHESEIRNVSGDDGAGADKSISADRHSAYDGAIGSQSRAMPDKRRTQLVHPADFASRIVDIGKHNRWAAKYVVLERDSFVYRDIILNFHSVADGDIRPDHDVLTDPAIPADPGIAQNMRDMPDGRASPISTSSSMKADSCTE